MSFSELQSHCGFHRSIPALSGLLRQLCGVLRFLHCCQSHVQHSNELFLCCRYARKNFSNSSDHLLKDIQQAMGLLAFDHSTRIKRYQKLFSLTRWAGLIDQFRQENFALFQLSQRSVLSVTLQAGLSALKTPYPQIPCSRHSQP